ncbi:MAG: TIGR03668 family PPOX class F420-dependent oxidoreductase [Actinomycetota bacterium]
MSGGSCLTWSELPPEARRIVGRARRAVLATVGRDGAPHAVPVCFALRAGELVTAVDQKPKRGGKLARVAHVRADPSAAIVVDRWDEDWTQLGWVMFQGEAHLDEPGSATATLVERYPQYRDDPPQGEVIVLRPRRILWWMWE